MTVRPSVRNADFWLRWLFAAVLLARLAYPWFDSPLNHLFSDPDRHWHNGAAFLNPTMIGAGDPYLYQLWIWLLRTLTHDNSFCVLLSCGLLCATMPYGWYRALRELVPRKAALIGALLMGLMPSFLDIYSFFMNETLLLSLTGFAFWLTLRAARKRTLAAWTLCSVVWSATVFTRVVMLPVAGLCLASLWFAGPFSVPQRAVRGGIAIVAALLLAVPAALHSHQVLNYYAPLGNTYITSIYRISGRHDIALHTGSGGDWQFGSPSFSNATFYPFWDRMTARQGVAVVTVDLAHGRADWAAERERFAREPQLSGAALLEENVVYLLFGQSWPDNNTHAVLGLATIWNRWLWLPLILYIGWGTWRRGWRGWEWLLPVSSLGMVVYLALQTTAIMEGRYRKPIEPLLLAAAVVLCARDTGARATRKTLA